MRSFIHKLQNKNKSGPSPYHSEDTVTSQNNNIECVCISDLYLIGQGTYPRATRLQDGSILGTHTTFQNGENIIVTTKSTDEGMTWSSFGEVTRGVGDIDNPFVIQLQNGNILCAFRNHSKNPAGGYTHFRITISLSEDGGKDWKYLSTPEESVDPVKGLWEPFMKIAKDGSLQLYYSRENGVKDQDSMQRISKDGGTTWGEVIAFSGHGIIARDGMLGVAEFGDELVAVFETNEEGPMHIKAVISRDDGKTWGNRQLVYHAPRGFAAAPQIANCGGVLIVSFQTDEDGKGTCLKIVVGHPGNWGNKTLIGSGNSYWGGMIRLDDSNALVMFDNGGCKARKITLKC